MHDVYVYVGDFVVSYCMFVFGLAKGKQLKMRWLLTLLQKCVKFILLLNIIPLNNDTVYVGSLTNPYKANSIIKLKYV